MRSPREVIPEAGFYERVRSRIERIEQQSIWTPFIYSRFPARLAISLFTLSLATVSCVVTAEWHSNEASRTLDDNGLNAIVSPADVQLQRAAVLMQIATYRQSK